VRTRGITVYDAARVVNVSNEIMELPETKKPFLSIRKGCA
jgi:hypothetical protein